MYELDLDNAFSEISQACENRPGKQSPFFFIVGAGISAPTIPLALEIQSECKTIAVKHRRSAEPKTKSAIDNYSHWFELAFPNAEQRQRYLRDKIQGKLISPAVFRLAHLLLSRAAGNIVVTPNFDDFLSRALTLFGEQHIVCDHPSTVGRISIEADDIQILHVHGTYWFYDCCNLKAEITKRADQINSGPVTIASFLEHLLWNRSPIVLGYSGWEGDVIMSALQRRLQTPMPFNLYWFCYRRSDCESLPSWIRDNPNVRLITPPASGLLTPDKADVPESAPAEIQILNDGSIGTTTIPARKILDRLLTAFELESPQLTKDPLQFFAKQLGQSILRDEDERAKDDIYSFQSVLARVEAAARLLKQSESAQSAIEGALETIRDAIRRSDYRSAIQVARTAAIAHATSSQVEDFLTATLAAAEGLGDNSIDELDGYQIVADSAEVLMDKGVLEDNTSAKWAKALGNKAVTLTRLARDGEAIAVCDEVVRRFGKATAPDLRKQVVRAQLNKGIILTEQGHSENAIALFDEVVQGFGESYEPALREQAAKALANKGWALGRSNRSEEAVALYDELLRRFGESSEPALREQVAKALASKGWSLGQLNRNEDAIGAYDEVVRRFGESTEPAVCGHVARALTNKGWCFGQLNRREDAIASYDEVVRRFGESTEPALRDQVARALTNKGWSLGQLNRTEDAIAVYDEVVQRFAQFTEPALREQVARALSNKGWTLVELNRSEDAIAAYELAVQRLRGATELALLELMSRALLAQARLFKKLDQVDRMKSICNEIVRDFKNRREEKLRTIVADAKRLMSEGGTKGPAGLAVAL